MDMAGSPSIFPFSFLDLLDTHVSVLQEYGFRGSSACCRAMLQFFYMGYILELEDPEVAIEPHQQQISELLEFSLIRGREGLGGLAEYLVKKLSTKGLMDASTAVQRLALAMSLATSVGPDVRIQVSRSRSETKLQSSVGN